VEREKSGAQEGQAELATGGGDGCSSQRVAATNGSRFEVPGPGYCWSHLFPISSRRRQDVDARSGPAGDRA
jgi:hypothetical protein